MTDDEAFIRCIVDSPGDDLPRLAYADWLDDRADPRGPYLRAEREALATGDTSRMRERAAGLDPVWVARVSRPPLGVCCDGLEFSGSGPAVTDELLHRAEAVVGLPITGEYRAFLLNYNGGRPTLRDESRAFGLWGPPGECFYSLGASHPLGDRGDLTSHAIRFRSILPDSAGAESRDVQPGDSWWWPDVLPIGGTYPAFEIFYAVRGPYVGLLHLHDWSADFCRFGFIGPPPTLGQFLLKLTSHGRPLADTYPGTPLQDFWKS